MCDAAPPSPASASFACPSAPGVHSPGAGKGQTAVFCTALLASDASRYQGWVDYYTAFFAGLNVDLYLFNDGPASASLDCKGARLVTFGCALGRQDTWIFPGWKRSFSAAVGQLSADYRFVGHVESDTVILQTGRAAFLNALHRPGYCTGYTARHGFDDTLRGRHRIGFRQ